MEVLEDETLAFLLALSFSPTILRKHRPKIIYQVTRLSLISHWYFKFFKIFISLNGAIHFHCLGWFWAPSVLKGVTSWSSLAGPLPLLALAPWPPLTLQQAALATLGVNLCVPEGCSPRHDCHLQFTTWRRALRQAWRGPWGRAQAPTNEISQIVLFSVDK